MDATPRVPAASTMNRFFTRYSFKIIVLVVFLLPLLTRSARLAMTSNDNKVEDWLPKEYAETQDLEVVQATFRKRDVHPDQLGRVHARRSPARAARKPSS